MIDTTGCSNRRPPGARHAALAALGALPLILTGLSSGAVVATRDPPASAPQESALAPTAPDLSVDEILRLNAAARGGKEAWRKIKTMVQIGRIERSNEVPGMAPHRNGTPQQDAI